MKSALKFSLNVLNAFVLPFGVLIAYEAFSAYSTQLAFPKTTTHSQNMEIMYTTAAFFGLLVTCTGIVGAVLVNIDAVILRTLYSIVLGGMTLVFVVLWIATHVLMDEYTDDIVFAVYRAAVNYSQPEQAKLLDAIHRYAHCCGARGVKSFWNRTNLPSSCCPPSPNYAAVDSYLTSDAVPNCTKSNAYNHTCEVKATRKIVKRVYLLTTFMLALAGYFTSIIILEIWF